MVPDGLCDELKGSPDIGTQRQVERPGIGFQGLYKGHLDSLQHDWGPPRMAGKGRCVMCEWWSLVQDHSRYVLRD